ncbi:hypothetical protein DSTSK_28140 [Desulforhabdus sp. TSK]|nr:hypothetical protein DSTSK_28140 [Desulforhabdus sp. TSK]
MSSNRVFVGAASSRDKNKSRLEAAPTKKTSRPDLSSAEVPGFDAIALNLLFGRRSTRPCFRVAEKLLPLLWQDLTTQHGNRDRMEIFPERYDLFSRVDENAPDELVPEVLPQDSEP